MNKEDAIKHYTENYVIPSFFESMADLHRDVFTNKDSIHQEFLKAFENLCKKACEMQGKEEKGKIKYINISALRTAIVTKSAHLIIEAYDNEWYLDSSECTIKFDAGWLYEPLYRFLSNMEKECKKYGGIIASHDLQRIVFDLSDSYFWYVVQIARHSVEQFINSGGFLSLEKESEHYILSGEYKDYCQIIYCNKNSVQDSEETKKHFQSRGDKNFSNGFYREFDLAGGQYNFFDFSYSSFRNSNLSNNEMIGSILWGTDFKNSCLNQCKLSASIIHDANFEGAELGFVQMEKIFADVRFAPQFEIPTGCIGVSFKDANIYDSSFKGSILFGAQFKDARLTRVDFQGCDLQYCDFQGATIEEINLHDAILNHSIFHKEQIKFLKLSDGQMKTIHIVG